MTGEPAALDTQTQSLRGAGLSRESLAARVKKIWLKPVVFVLCLIPLVALVYAVLTGSAGPNPIEAIEQQTGEWTLRFLLLSLVATPLTRLFKIAWPVRLRRMIGLFAFFYASVHLAAYLVLDQSLLWRDIILDIAEKPFIAAGFAGFVIMLPLAVTSNRFSVKQLGKRWKSLHQWVYFAAVAAVLHFVWLAKGDRLEPIVYVLILLVLLAYRLVGVVAGSKR